MTVNIRNNSKNWYLIKNVPSTVPNTQRIAVTRAVSIIETDCKDSTESTAPANSSTKKVKQLIWVVDLWKLMTDAKYKNWSKIYNPEKKLNEVTNGTNNLAVDKPSTSESNSKGVERSFNGKDNIKVQLIKYDSKYQKQF